MQLVALQLPQELPPIEEVSPLSSLVREQNVDSIRSALLWQWGQEASSVAWFSERSNSNFRLQLEQLYSYNGIFLSLRLV